MGTPSKKIPSKIFAKPLDKRVKVWYNNNTEREGKKLKCAECGYYYKTEEDRYPCCHFEGPEGWAPCEQEEPEEEKDEDE